MTTNGSQSEPERIKKFVSIEDAGTYKNFRWPTGLNSFGKNNLLFGWNGSGKTTLSRLIRSIELKKKPDAKSCRIAVDNRQPDICSGDFNVLPLVRVFNRDFVAETIAADELSSILVISKDAARTKSKVDKKKARHSHLSNAFTQSVSVASRSGQKFDKYLVDEARKISALMLGLGRAGFKGFTKRSLEKEFESFDEDTANRIIATSDELRETLGNNPNSHDEAQVMYANLTDLLKGAKELVGRNIVVTAIEELDNNDRLRAWVQDGTRMHTDHKGPRCLYCGSNVSEARGKELEGYFNHEMDTLQSDLVKSISEFDDLEKSLDDGLKNLLDSSELLPKHRKAYRKAMLDFEIKAKAGISWLASVRRELAHRHKNPTVSQKIPAKYWEPPIAANIGPVNHIIKAHNKDVESLEVTMKDAAESLLLREVNLRISSYNELKTERDDIKVYNELVGHLLRRKSDEIDTLEMGVSGHLRPGKEVTEELRAYLGRDDLSLEATSKGYKLHRNGIKANASSLSEGEKTALSLLFFLKTLEDRDFKDKGGIVVIDDPVSSLDSNALFSAVGFIRNRLNEDSGIGQLFVLTHNFSFFTECQKWMRNKLNQYMVEAKGQGANRTSTIKKIDPMLSKYESEYHYLFKRVHDSSTALSLSWEDAYPLPNISRRLLDGFLAFRVPTKAKFPAKLSTAAGNFSQDRLARLERFLQLHSHGDWIPIPEQDLTPLDGVHSATKDVMEYLKEADSEHFRMMLEEISI